MTTPSYSSGEPNPLFNFKENNFADMPLPGIEENHDCWADQLNSSALELQSPMPGHSNRDPEPIHFGMREPHWLGCRPMARLHWQP